MVTSLIVLVYTTLCNFYVHRGQNVGLRQQKVGQWDILMNCGTVPLNVGQLVTMGPRKKYGN